MTPTVDILIQQAQLADREGRRDDARALYERALFSLDRSADATIASSLLRWIGRLFRDAGDIDAALDAFEAALTIAELADHDAEIGKAFHEQADIHRRLGNLDRAETLYLQARGRALDTQETRLAAMAAESLSLIAMVRGDHDRALRDHRASLAEYRALGVPKEVLASLRGMARLCTDLERWEDSARTIDEAAQIAEALGDIPERVRIEAQRAALEIARGDFVSAATACETGRSLAERSPEVDALGEIEKHLGAIARETGQFGAAEQHFERAQQIAVDQRDLLLSAETAREHAEACRPQGRLRDALIHLNRGHAILTQLAVAGDVVDVDRRAARLERQFLDVARQWAGSIESKDRHTQGHCERVADLACALAIRDGCESRELFWFRMGATVHDIGKLIIPAEVLNKPGKLAPDEWELIKRHPVAGVEMLAEMDFPGEVGPMVRSHHERWDGQGYPDGLAGEEIPRAARMLCIADVYDALLSKRSYKGALSHEAALEIMRSDPGQFDPALFGLFEDLMRTRAPSMRQRVTAQAHPTPEHRVTPARELTVAGPSDDLTGLLTRRPFIEIANTILGERGTFATMSLIVLDVDEFKQVNDQHGHLQGDAVLRVIAGTLRELAASSGIIGRYAGDEFVILLPHASIDEAGELAERIRATVRRTSIPLRERSGSISATLSIGVAGARPEHRDFDALFAVADRAMYEAKRRGRDTVVSASEGDSTSQGPAINLKHFVGRESESRRLLRILEAVENGPQLVSVVGEAGVGKSSLVRRLAGEARLRAGCLVAGQCSEAGNKPPYAPWAEVLTAIDSLGIVGAREWHELPRLVSSMSTAALAPEANRYALLNEIVWYLRLASETNPVVVLLDDMQWADAGSWDVLEHVMSQLEMEHILLCMTMRTEDMRGPALERRNRLLRDERFNEVPLSRLSDGDLRQWLSGVFGGEASRELSTYLQRYSEGNPLLATQVVRILLDAGVVRFEHGRWGLWSEPSRELTTALSGLMGRRLDRLTPEARSILNTAAVIGRVFDIDLAVAAGAGTEDEVLDALDQGIEHAVLEATDSSGCEFSFTHGLLVDAVRRSINPRRLARIHERVAAAMEERTPDKAPAIAVHYERAGLPLKAYPHAIMAGHEALSMYAQADARRFFEIAERAAPGPGERASALLGLAEVSEIEGRHALTEELCDRALATIGDGSNDHTLLALRRMRERTRSLQGRPARETIAVCTELLEKARSLGDRAEESALLTMISHCQDRLGDGAAAEGVAREAVAAAEAANDSRLLAESFTRLGSAIKDTNATEAQDFYGRALALFHAAGDRSGEARCQINIGKIYQRAGDMAAAEAAYDRGLETAQSAQAGDLAGLASLNLGTLYLRRGQLALAGERYGDALERFAESSNETDRLSTLFNMAHLAREAEDWGTASALYEQVMAVAARIGQPDVELGARAGQALAALAVGARSVAEDAMRWIRANVETRPQWWFQGRDLVDALRIRLAAERGDDAHAMRLLADAVTLAGQHDIYLAAYLVSECAPSLRREVSPLVALIDQLLPEVETFGLTGARKRLINARMSLLASAAA
ncbi:MAG TPA: HD domain-containing phosphohydrolase [Gemmatimonadaceae bacterium]|jgi:diguanylate cyclase (GGDEF)-like protein|nr:HD domain-containing phosphohydrolase [Gemmatimonadaceae bacterium]